jgi:hypothetical protein
MSLNVCFFTVEYFFLIVLTLPIVLVETQQSPIVKKLKQPSNVVKSLINFSKKVNGMHINHRCTQGGGGEG